ncbi:MAG: hypothetical protein K6A65_02685, partial [Succinivibrionaceae bacterium]|nr:hypothetical protein [Succinivibrionaceae bacterium]
MAEQASRLEGDTVTISGEKGINVKTNSSDADVAIASGGKVSITGKEISLNGSSKITFTSGRNSISINPESVSISSEYWPTNGTGAFSSSISVHPFNGVSIAGPAISASSKFKVSLTDGFGAGIKVSHGSSEINGTAVKVKTMSHGALVDQGINTGVEDLREIMAAIKMACYDHAPDGTIDPSKIKEFEEHNTKALGAGKCVSKGVAAIVKYTRKVKKAVKDKNWRKTFAESDDVLSLLVGIVDTLLDLYDLAVTIVSVAAPDWFKSKVNDHTFFTNGAAMHLAGNITKHVEAQVILIVNACMTSDLMCSEISLRGSGDITIKSSNSTTVTGNDSQGINVLYSAAGLGNNLTQAANLSANAGQAANIGSGGQGGAGGLGGAGQG